MESNDGKEIERESRGNIACKRGVETSNLTRELIGIAILRHKSRRIPSWRPQQRQERRFCQSGRHFCH